MDSTLHTTFLTHSEWLMIQFLAWLNQVALLNGLINLRKEYLKGWGGGGEACFAHDCLIIHNSQAEKQDCRCETENMSGNMEGGPHTCTSQDWAVFTWFDRVSM